MSPDKRTSDASRNRRLVSQLLVAALFAVAYSETVDPVTKAFNRDGLNIQTLAWLLIYMVTVLRFFIGNILHLESPDLTGPRAAFKWFWDFFFIVIQCVVLIFAGAVTTIEASAAAHVSFPDYLLILYGLDVVWLGSMQLLSRAGERWPSALDSMVREKDMAPLEWAAVNTVLGVLMWKLGVLGHPGHISDVTLSVLVGANLIAFLDDVVKIAYGIREPDADTVSPLAPPIRSIRSGVEGLIHRLARTRPRVSQPGSGMIDAIASARQSAVEGGIPIGAALVDAEGNTLGVGHNRRVQDGNPTLHAELDCMTNVGSDHGYADTTLYSTLMPCYMCAGAIVQFGIPRVVVGESRNFRGARDLLIEHGVDVVELDDPELQELLGRYISSNPEVWREDIGG